VAIAAVFAVAAAPASAAAPPAWTQEADAIAAPWPGLQEADGRFKDYVLARDPNEQRDDYGDAMLGYALLLSAARTGDATLADSGLRAVEYALERAARSPSTQVFHQLATVSAYNLARTRFASHPVFQRARARWEDVLKRIEVYRLGRQKVTNKSIVETILLLELLRSGLSSDVDGAALEDPEATRRTIREFLATDLPKAARSYRVGARTVFGDMPLLPPAYHALSIGMLARTLELLGDDAPSAARKLLESGVLASRAAAAPDGDVAYHGRSQLQAWTLTLTAYGASRAGHGGLAAQTVQRLIDGYGSGPEGFLVTPSLAQDIEDALPGLDEYLAGASYVGLTLMALEWAIPSAPEAFTDEGYPPGVLGTGSGAWATADSGRVWFAVKRTRTSTFDLRYDFGLVALKRYEDGAWRDVLPARPRTTRAADSAGPVLLSGGTRGYPEGTSIATAKGNRVVVKGGFRASNGRWLRKGVTFTFAPTSCGVRLTFNGRANDLYEYSGFFRADPKRSGNAVQDETQRLAFGARPSVTYRGEYASGSDVGLVRATARVRNRSLHLCGR
jgi:hypothetical protein